MSLKSLYLLRHAKAVEGGILYEDKDRPLSEKGLKDARRIGENLLKKSLFNPIDALNSLKWFRTHDILGPFNDSLNIS